MKEIQLSQGKVALVDDEMFDLLNSFKWHAHRAVNSFYAYRRFRKDDGKQGNLAMHHMVAGFPLNGYEVDHIQGNTLDNRRSMLRVVTKRQNMQNTRIQREADKSSKYIGVCWDKSRKKWLSSIQVNGKNLFLGRFDTQEAAFQAYQNKAKELIQSHLN